MNEIYEKEMAEVSNSFFSIAWINGQIFYKYKIKEGNILLIVESICIRTSSQL